MKCQKLKIMPHSDEWYMARLSKFSSSEVHKLMGEPRKKDQVFSDTAISYILEKVSETISNVLPDQATSASMSWGVAHESEAIGEFSRIFQETVETGTVYHYDENFCGTPDGETATHILEVKCPYNGGNHIKNTMIRETADLKTIRPEYYWQVQCNMALSGKDKSYFISYDPRLPNPVSLHVVEIEMCEDDVIAAMEKITMAGKYKSRVIMNLAEQFVPKD